MPPRITFRRSCLAVALGQTLALPSHAASITVTSAGDVSTDDEVCTLREAVVSANQDTNVDEDACASGAGKDTITFANSLLGGGSVTVQLTQALDLPITTDMVISGPGLDVLTIDGMDNARVFRVDTASLEVADLTITGGLGFTGSGGGGIYALSSTLFVARTMITGNSGDDNGGGLAAVSSQITILDAIISANTASFDGGGFRANSSTVTLSNSEVSGNTAPDVGGIRLSGTSIDIVNTTIVGNGGGGIQSNNSTLVINGSSISSNYTDSYPRGGGIELLSFDNLVAKRSMLFNNAADNGGGLAISASSSATIEQTSVSGNTAQANGGGIDNAGTLILIQAEVSGNTAQANGGGIDNAGTLILIQAEVSGNHANNGGGINTADTGTVQITNSTLSGNSVSNRGGGIADYVSVGVTIASSTISVNTAGAVGGGIYTYDSSLSLTNTIVSGNSAGDDQELYNDMSSITANKGNLFGDSGKTQSQAFDGFLPGVSDIDATSDGGSPYQLAAMLGPLASNGGPTRTHALVDESPALDAGDNTDCGPGNSVATDQRGEARDDSCDIGAFEFVERQCFAVPGKNGGIVVFCL